MSKRLNSLVCVWLWILLAGVTCMQAQAPPSVSATSTSKTVKGTGTTGRLPKWTGADTIGDSIVTEANGNVGIGVSSPVARLEVIGDVLSTTVGATMINAHTQYNLGGARVLAITGADNLFTGVGAGATNTTGSENAFFGSGAGFFNTTGDRNSFFGRRAGFSNTEGGDNAFFGNRAGNRNTEGNNNAFFGTFAGTFNTTGDRNAFFGTSAGQGNTTGSDNAFFGMGAGLGNSGGGIGNTVFGAFAGNNFFTGNFNTLIGYQADVPNGATNITQATALGAFATVGCSNCLVLGATGISAVNVGIGLTTPAYRLHLAEDSAAKPGSASWTVASDRRLKRDIRPYTDGLATLLQLNPVWYRYNGQAGLPSYKDYVGVIAQEAQAVAAYTVSAYRAKLNPQDAEATELLNFDGGALPFMTINAVRELHTQLTRLQSENVAQRHRISDLEQRLATLEEMIRKLTASEPRRSKTADR